MAYTAPQIGLILLKADRTMYKIGQIAYDNMFAEDNEALDYERDIIFIYKKAVEYADDFFIGTEKLDKVVEKLAAKISAYDYGALNPIYADSASVSYSLVQFAAGLNDLTDVTITNLQDNQYLRYDASTGQWINEGPGSAIRNSQAFTATAGQTVFITAYPFQIGLFDLYLNGVKLNSASYNTLGQYQITLIDGCTVGDILDIVIYDATASIIPNPITSWGTIVGTLSSQTDLQNALNGKYNNPTGTISQYIRGDGSLATLTASSVWGNITGTLSNQTDLQNALNAKFDDPTGTAAQYIRGDGQLANFPDNQGGGSSVNYYLNGSVSQGTFGGDTYYEMSKTPILGAGTNFTRTNAQGNGYIASFITDAGDPSLLNIPAGNWNVEFYFQANSNAGNPQFYAELYKVDASNNFTLVGSGSTNPEGITNGTTIDQYYTAIPIPQTSLLVTDRLAIRIFVIPSGRTITLHTENSNLCEVLTTLSTGLNALNGLTSQVQYFATGTSGTDFAISSATDTHTFNLPTASATNRGALSSADWSSFNSKQNALTNPITGTGTAGQVAYFTGATSQGGSNNLFWDNTNGRLGIGTNVPSQPLHISGTGTGLNGRTFLRIQNNQISSGAALQLINGNNRFAALQYSGSTYGTGEALSAFTESDHPISLSTNGAAASGGTSFISFSAGGYDNEAMRVTGTKRILIGSTSDSGQRLQVTGDTLLKGSGNTSATTALTVQDSGGNFSFSVGNDRHVRFGFRAFFGSGQVFSIGPDSTAHNNFRFNTSSNYLGFYGDGIANAIFSVTPPSANNSTGTNITLWGFAHTFAPTSGTASYVNVGIATTINQTGGANGITRGLYVNPTITAAADWRAIETSVGGAYFNTTSVQASAILQADSTIKGFLPPRMTTTQKLAITSPATGLQVYDTTLNQNAFYNGSAWVSGGGSSTGTLNFIAQHTSLTYADATTYYFGATPTVPSANQGAQRGVFNKGGTIKSIYLFFRSATTPTTEFITLQLWKAAGNGTLTSVLSTLIAWSGTSNLLSNPITLINIPVTAGDTYEFSISVPSMVGNPSNVFCAGNIELEY
jgi:hypothetical protein